MARLWRNGELHQDDTAETLSSSPLRSTPKWQLSAEQPSTEKTGACQQRSPATKDAEKETQRDRRGSFMTQSNPVPPGARPTSWRRTALQRFAHQSERAEHSRPPGPGVQHFLRGVPRASVFGGWWSLTAGALTGRGRWRLHPQRAHREP